MTAKIPVTVWTSSHAKYGGFKRKIKGLFKKSNRFEEPIVVYKGGLKMSFNIAKKIIKDVKSQEGKPQAHVVQLGDNNLRWFENEPEEVMAMFHYLLSEVSKIQKCKIIITTLMPTLQNIENNLETFTKFDQDLETKLNLDPKYDLLDLRKSLKSKNGDIKEKFFKMDGKMAGVHLNEQGAMVLCNQIFNKLERLPRKFFE